MGCRFRDKKSRHLASATQPIPGPTTVVNGTNGTAAAAAAGMTASAAVVQQYDTSPLNRQILGHEINRCQNSFKAQQASNVRKDNIDSAT